MQGEWEMEFNGYVKSSLECPLVAMTGTLTCDHDIAPPLRSGFQTLLTKNSPKFRWEVERRWNRGRDGGPGPSGETKVRG